ncbi:hypothetical protein L6452_03445 [Arctium lappa]|uniref:Uncharacterized protein n=1 Tax=Arctium lappa TaxID=4217 RepID=A0ACB9FN88_ARCLA|nr:hypothetical protein L6452_03445 [Arctium lappa]
MSDLGWAWILLALSWCNELVVKAKSVFQHDFQDPNPLSTDGMMYVLTLAAAEVPVAIWSYGCGCMYPHSYIGQRYFPDIFPLLSSSLPYFFHDQH